MFGKGIIHGMVCSAFDLARVWLAEKKGFFREVLV
jgi:hypothetical protein